VVQRFGGALNVHFHTLLLDGVYARDAQSGRLRWHRVGHPSTRTIEQLVVRIADRAEEWLSEQGYGTDEQAEPDPDDGQAVLQAAAVMGRAAMGSRRGCQSLGRWGQLCPGADLGLLGATHQSKTAIFS
jgi:hypothetical protein